MQNAFGTAVETANNSNWVQDGELVTCMFLKRTLINRYMKEIERKNAEEKEKRAALGIEFTPQPFRYKDCGIAWDFAILARSKTENKPILKVLQEDEEGNFIDPHMKFTGRIEMPPLTKILEFPTNRFRFGGGIELIDGHPKIESLLPNAFPEKDWDSQTVVTDLVEADYPRWPELIEKENKRQAEWENLLKIYSSMNEEQATDALERHLSMVYLLCEEKEGELVYHKPQKGIIFNAKVKLQNGKYLNLVPFEFGKPNTYFQDRPVSSPTSETIEVADKVNKLINDIQKEYRNKQQAALAEHEEAKNEKPF